VPRYAPGSSGVDRVCRRRRTATAFPRRRTDTGRGVHDAHAREEVDGRLEIAASPVKKGTVSGDEKRGKHCEALIDVNTADLVLDLG